MMIHLMSWLATGVKVSIASFLIDSQAVLFEAFCVRNGTEMRTPKRLLVTCSVAVLLLLTACQSDSNEIATPSPSGPQDPDLQVDKAGYHGHHFAGPVYLPSSSPMVDGTTAYNVTYQPGITVVSKEDTLRHLVAIKPDGTCFFDSTALQIAKLKSGGVLLLSGRALRTVVSVQKTETGYAVKTASAMITDAIKDGRLEGSYKIDFSRTQTVADFDVDFTGYNYHVQFTPARDRINLKATIKFGGSQGVLAYEGLGYLSNFVSTIRMQIKDGQLTNLEFSNANLAGQVELKWFAVAGNDMKAGSIAKITSWPAELLKNNLLSKAAYHVPIVLGAVPFDLRISLGFSFIPAFTSKNSVIEGSKLIKYSGSGGFNLAGGQTKPFGSMDVQEDTSVQGDRVVAAGPVGFTAATEAPRLELVMGWPPAALPVAAYLNFVASYGIVTNGRVDPVPCQTNILAFSVNAGAAYTSPNTFATWFAMPVGSTPAVSLWSKTIKSAGPGGNTCPN
jgi:hypothetical protein